LKFAKIVFLVAGVWGLLVLTPLYFMFDLIGQKDPPPITHPGFFYGFAGLGLAWQLAFIVISRDTIRYRLMMLPSIVEKFSYAIAIVVLVLQHRTRPTDLLFAATDTLLGILFIASWFATSSQQSRSTT
jgi:vacuolar-type H+-ATPase subunit I/STV1